MHSNRRRPTLDRKNPTPSQQTRRDRRAAENRERFEAAREERRNRASARASGGRGGGSSSFGLITIGAVVVGVVIIAALAFTQLGGGGGGGAALKEPTASYPAGLRDGRAIGRADAPVTMEVFEDFQCPVCARHSLTVEPVLIARYVNEGTLRIVHRDLAFLGRGGADDESVIAASAASCALAQDRYFDFTPWLYENQDGENQGGFRRSRVDAIAEQAGLDMAAYRTCMDDPATRAKVQADTKEITALGVTSTPTIRINGGQLIAGLQTADALGAAIEAAASAAPSGSGSPAPSGSATP